MNQPIELGDIVSLSGSLNYNVCTVSQVHADGTVDLFRPYTHTSDFSCAGREKGSVAVLCYVGVETVKGVKTDHLTLVRKAGPIR